MYNVFSKYLFYTALVVFLNFSFFLIVDNIFYLSLVKKNFNYFYIKYFFTTITLIFILQFFLKKLSFNKKIDFEIKTKDLYKILKIILTFCILGTIFTASSKYSYYYVYENGINVCIINKYKNLWVLQHEYLEAFKNTNRLNYLFYEIFSPLGLILINFFYILIFFKIFFENKLKNKQIVVIDITILISLIVYFIFTGSKNIFLSAISFYLSCMIIKFIISNIKLKNIINFILFFSLCFFVILGEQVLRYKCLNTDFNSTSKFLKAGETKKPEIKTDTGLFNLDDELNRFVDKSEKYPYLNYTYKFKNNSDSYKGKDLVGKYFYDTREDISKKKVGIHYMFNYFLYYITTGKQQGELNIEKNKEAYYKFLTFKKGYNVIPHSFFVHFKIKNDLAFDIPKIYKNLGPVALISYLYLDFNFFGIFIFIIIPLIIIFLLRKNYNNKYLKILILFITHMILFNLWLSFIIYGNKISNSIIVYFNFLIVLFLLTKFNYLKINLFDHPSSR